MRCCLALLKPMGGRMNVLSRQIETTKLLVERIIRFCIFWNMLLRGNQHITQTQSSSISYRHSLGKTNGNMSMINLISFNSFRIFHNRKYTIKESDEVFSFYTLVFLSNVVIVDSHDKRIWCMCNVIARPSCSFSYLIKSDSSGWCDESQSVFCFYLNSSGSNDHTSSPCLDTLGFLLLANWMILFNEPIVGLSCLGNGSSWENVKPPSCPNALL